MHKTYVQEPAAEDKRLNLLPTAVELERLRADEVTRCQRQLSWSGALRADEVTQRLSAGCLWRCRISTRASSLIVLSSAKSCYYLSMASAL